MRRMISFIAGLLAGMLLMSGGVVYAATGILAERSTDTVYVDGKRVELEAYRIGGSNYVKLRDVGRAVDFNVYWDGTAVRIDREAAYTGEAPMTLPATAPAPTVPVEVPVETPAPAIPDYSAQANAGIFDSVYTREAYNALRQSIVTGTDSGPAAMSESTRQAMDEATAAIGMWPAYDSGTVRGGNVYFHMKYPAAYQEAADYCLPYVESLSDLGEEQKVRQLAFFVCERLSYDAGSNTSPRTVLVSDAESRGNCMSYAHNFKFLCDMAGIPCIFVHSVNHQWNAVYVNGQWWAADLTTTDIGYSEGRGENTTVLIPENSLQGYMYQQTQPQLTLIAKELLVPGSTA